jgi:hypothetical protein
MTQEEREAVEFVEWAAKQELWPLMSPTYARTLQRLLSRPALPDVNDHAAIDELLERYNHSRRCTPGISRGAFSALLAIMREPKPRTKEVEVWRVECAQLQNKTWFPLVCTYGTEIEARGSATELEKSGIWRCISVTGPHKQEVPDEGATP